MALLRSGSEQVCVAPDVQSTLKDIILPKAEDVAGDTTLEEKLAAIARIKVGYELTTIQHYDKDVAKADCQSTIVMTGAGNGPTKLQVTYQVAPAAEDPNSFIVQISGDEAQAYGRQMVATALNEAAAQRSQEQADAESARLSAEQAQQQAQVARVVSERWLRGVWILDDAAPATCATSSAVRFQDGHVFTGALGDGRWALSGADLHLIGTQGGQAVDYTLTFESADAFSGVATPSDGGDGSTKLRRCTQAETQVAPAVSDPVQVIDQ